MAKRPGSIWIQGDTFHYVGAGGVEWSVQGEFVQWITARPGSVWMDSFNLHYINQGGYAHFRCPIVIDHTGAGRRWGSIWVQGDAFYIQIDPYTCRLHADVAHQDVGINNHTDVHTDSAHTDLHGDYPHQDYPHNDWHQDWGHGDSHTDYHGDNPHTNIHNDYHEDFVPPPGHSDCHIYQNGEYYSHGDFYDSISVGPYPCMWHDDTPFQDTPHTNQHADVPHHDDPGANDHLDSPHGDYHDDTHTDVGHGDVPHQDHTDISHTDVTHVDNPTYIGP